MNTDELTPLPENISKDMRSLRNVEPSSALVERAMAKLPEGSASQTAPKKDGEKRRGAGPRHSLLIFMIPAAAVAAAALLFVAKFGQPTREAMVRMEEKTVAIHESGHEWTALDLQTHHHADEPAVVHLDIPTNVRVRLPVANGADGDVDERHCTENRCIHRFTQHHGKGVPLRIAVTHPGRYDIHVRHESKVAAMREHFVLTANRK
jgi:hypothetical protein